MTRRRLMRAKVIEEDCTGCGSCVEICPEVFEMGDDDLAHVIADPVPEGAEDKCEEACESCPADAIEIEK